MALRLTLIILALLTCWTQLLTARHFSTLEEVRGNGSVFLNATTTSGVVRQFIFFPSMKFTCSGSITAVRYLAQPGNRNYTFFGLLTVPGAHPRAYIDTNNFEKIEGSGTGFEQRYEIGYEVHYQNGYVFAMHQTLALLFHMQVREKVKTCNFTDYWTGEIMCSESSYKPVVTIETDHPECISGFTDEAAFRHLMAATTLNTPQSEIQFRNIRFECNNKSIKKWTIGARISEDTMLFESSEQISVYLRDNHLSRPFHFNSLTTTPYINVYEHEYSIKSFVRKGAFLAVKSNQIYYQYCALPECAPQPLVAADFDCPDADRCDYCTRNFIGVEELIEKARYIPNFAELSEEYHMFPELRITQEGTLERLTITAEMLQPAPSTRPEYPQLIILPSDFTSEETINCSCDGVHCLSISTAVETEYPNVYEVLLEPPVPVRAGEYIAVQQPPRTRAAMMLKFVRVPPPQPKRINSSRTLPLHPLVHLHIAGFHSTDVTPTVRPSCTPHSNKDGKKTDSGAIAGGVTVAVLLLLAIATAGVLAVLCVRRRAVSAKVQTEGTTNPVYDTNFSASASPTEASGGARDSSQIYSEPDKPSRGPPSSGGGHSELADDGYARLTETCSRNIDSLENAEYFHTHTVSDTAGEPHYEFAIYVPTKEQRENLSRNENNIYATLEEAQIGNGKMFFEECEIYWDPALNREDLYAQLACRKYREIPSHRISVTGHLGSGQFGNVNRGVWQDGSRCVDVAIKTLQNSSSEEEAVRFLQEAAIMGQFRHPNIVQLLGVVTVVKPVMIVTELATNGNLREFLLSAFSTDPGELPPPDTAVLLTQFCLQVARGMEYLSGKAFVHRDLAARNILVTDNKTCKISDFGLSRDLLNDAYYVSHGGQIPIKWTAPEALHYKKYSTASDVWSFGCLMYEIWSLGHKPFEGYTNIEVMGLVDKGHRLASPPGCPKEMYRLMIACWNADKSGRPQFREIVETLSQPEHLLLHIPEEVTRGHPQASILGAPLEAGRDLYIELQNTYL